MTRRDIVQALYALDRSPLPPWHPERLAIEAKLIEARVRIEATKEKRPRVS